MRLNFIIESLELLGVAVFGRQPLLAFYPYLTPTGIFRSIVYCSFQFCHLLSCFVRLNVGIDVCRLLDIGVSKKTLHNPDIHLCINATRGKCVT